ncbi:sulfotransferase family protein [Rhizomonospora bruguierae]|uniref:sulfotransferase family protein n=1 Tax=Rhizomonospora bruguierae TaxID=1581705 RepID=UPI001BD03A17|nr:sulfotransferase [Micromonospora sp. NBRC 107566]
MSVAPDPVRLVPRPVFLLSSIRSGSTLLRCLLDSHPAVHAPHELHLRYLHATITSEYTELAMATLGYSDNDLRYLLWDGILADRLRRSGKAVLVDKSPSNTFIHEDLRRCWPRARFIVLRRHPADIVASIVNADDGRDEAEATELVLRYARELDAVVDRDPGTPVVQYEDLAGKPARVCAELCRFLEVPFDESMLDYGRHDHGPLVYGIGDWGEKIRSGKVHAPWPPAARTVTGELAELCRRWRYPTGDRSGAAL